MKTLTKHTMVYDADCPLCSAYTNAFIATKMLDVEGRIPYQQAGGEFVPGMDAERAKNEIALVNRETGEVKYGLESLLTIIETRFRWIGIVARIQPLKLFIQKLYNFISYNRKVIMPANGTSVLAQQRSGSVAYDCTPTFKLKYRLAYIAFVWLLTSLVLVEYSKLLGGLIPATNFYREFLICGGQVLFQSISVAIFLAARMAVPSLEVRKRAKGEQLMNYLGNMMTVSLIGAIFLLPGLLIGKLLPAVPSVVWILYFMLVVGIMLYEHARRMKILQLGWWPSASWVLYRILVLGVILYPFQS